MYTISQYFHDTLNPLFAQFLSQSDAEWAQKNPLDEGMGVNCKTLLLLFLVLTAIKIVAFTDFIDPMKLLADRSLQMTDFAMWMWKFTAVLILEVFLAMLYALLFDDDAGHELVVFTIVILSVVPYLFFGLTACTEFLR